jgi:hypothetical protein
LQKRDIVEKWSPQDWREFDRWIKANAIVGSLLAAGLFAMAVAGVPSAGPVTLRPPAIRAAPS